MKISKIIGALILMGAPFFAKAQEAPFTVAPGLFDQTDENTLGLTEAPGAQTFTVFAPSATTDHFSHGVVMGQFKGALYCMWQSSATDEDGDDTWVAYARSTDGGATWSQPMTLAKDIDNGYCTSGGWWVSANQIVGYINEWHTDLSPKGGFTRYVASTDGLAWTDPKPVTMADGTEMAGVMEQDPRALKDGRIVSAAHFQPGTMVCPIYTDDPMGISGWKKGAFDATGKGTSTREMEPSLYLRGDSIVMIYRDQNSTYYKLASVSTDRGETWTKAVLTNMPDSRQKQSAGNLPDGTAFFAGCPILQKVRYPLALTLSDDGYLFDRAWLLRSRDSSKPMRYAGKNKHDHYYSYPKSLVTDDYLYVAYATNKEDVEYTRIPVAGVATAIASVRTRSTAIDPSAPVYTLSGTRMAPGNLPKGVYIQHGRKFVVR